MKTQLKTMTKEVSTIIDGETGEVLDVQTKVHKYLSGNKEEFFLCYSSMIGVFMNMSQAEIRIFAYCLRFAKGVKFDISKKLRLSMAKEIGVNERTILNTLPSLLVKQVIFLHTDGLYQLNPRYAYQGSTGERDRALKMIIEVGCKDC
jgi:hypothetical protein